MKLEYRAYKCVFPELYTDAYNRYLWEDPKQFELIFGKNQKEAVKERCSNDEFHTYWELKSTINTRRCEEEDLYSVEVSPALKNLSEKHIHHLTHSLGVSVGDKCPKEFYRNRSVYYKENKGCEELVSLGLMNASLQNDSHVYFVTRKGREAVKTLLLVNKSKNIDVI